MLVDVKTKPIPVRFSPDVLERLSAVADRIGTDRSSVVRMITRRFLDQFEEDPDAFVGIDFPALLHHSDGRRRTRYPSPSTKSIALNEPNSTTDQLAAGVIDDCGEHAQLRESAPAPTGSSGSSAGKKRAARKG